MRSEDIPELGVAHPLEVAGEMLVAFPLMSPMGWVSSPPCFCSVTQTVADEANDRILRGERPPAHQLERLAEAAEDNALLAKPATNMTTAPTPVAIPELRSETEKRRNRRQLGRFEVHMDDFLGLVQGGKR